MSEKKNILREIFFGFTVKMAILYKYLATNREKFVWDKQLLPGGTLV